MTRHLVSTDDADDLLGHLDAARIAQADPEQFAAVMAIPPAEHRFPGSMGGRIQALCHTLVAEYERLAA